MTIRPQPEERLLPPHGIGSGEASGGKTRSERETESGGAEEERKQHETKRTTTKKNKKKQRKTKRTKTTTAEVLMHTVISRAIFAEHFVSENPHVTSSQSYGLSGGKRQKQKGDRPYYYTLIPCTSCCVRAEEARTRTKNVPRKSSCRKWIPARTRAPEHHRKHDKGNLPRFKKKCDYKRKLLKKQPWLIDCAFAYAEYICMRRNHAEQIVNKATKGRIRKYMIVP